MFNDNKIVKMKKELFIEAESIVYLIQDPLKRKLAFANTCTLFAFRNYVEKNNFSQEPVTKSNLFRVPAVVEKYGISDIYLDDIRVDVRASLDGKVFPIPKVHIQNALAADFYVVFKGTKNPLKCEALGYISKEHLIFDSQDEDFYYISVAILNPLDEFKQELNNFVPQERTFYEAEHRIAMENSGAFLDGDLDTVKSNDLIKHLLACRDCREYFVDFSFLEDMMTYTQNYPDLKDTVLPQEENTVAQEETIEIPQADNTVETADINKFEFDNNTAEIEIGTEIPQELATATAAEEIISQSADFLDLNGGDDILDNLEESSFEISEDNPISQEIEIDDSFTDLSGEEINEFAQDSSFEIIEDNPISQEIDIDDSITDLSGEEISEFPQEPSFEITEDNPISQATEIDDSFLDLGDENISEPQQESQAVEIDESFLDLGNQENESETNAESFLDIEGTSESDNNESLIDESFSDVADSTENASTETEITDMQMESSIFDSDESNNISELELDISSEIVQDDNFEINYEQGLSDIPTEENNIENDNQLTELGLELEDNNEEIAEKPENIQTDETNLNNLFDNIAEEKAEQTDTVQAEDGIGDDVFGSAINTFYDKSEPTANISEEEITQPQINTATNKKSNPLLIASICIIGVAILGVGFYFLYFNNNSSGNDADLFPNAASGASNGQKSEDINQAMTNAFSDNNQGAIKVSKISWQVEQALSQNPDVAEYLKTLGQSIGDNLDTAIPYLGLQFPPHQAKILIKVNKNGAFDKIMVAESTGVDMLDNAIVQNIQKATESLPITSYVTLDKEINLILVVNF